MRYVCIHGHFYQPPRENPWIDAVEVQDSAAPYHDWNERITAECYWPNAAARLLGRGSRITAIVNNYASLSFNFGPTLCSWLARHEPDLLQHLTEADRTSRALHHGHGNALAQAYGHAILPLCNARDKTTQVVWGIHDFTHRFGRAPEGMWLPETAVDLATLEALAEHGIAFTILAPHQAKRIRPLEHTSWKNVTAEQLDTTRPYLCRLPSGKTISLFFYHGGLARGVAFEGLLDSGDRFAEQLVKAFQANSSDPQLVHLATDGESYGHHHRFGEMALAFAAHELERRNLAHLTNYGAFLALYPPRWEVEIAGNTSWSCAHGVERWRSNCGCRIGGQSTWTQTWRAPLRVALDWLSGEIDRFFERRGERLLGDPWAARNAYIEVLLDHTPERIDALCSRYAKQSLAPSQKVEVCKLLEMQRSRLLMFTSCGWFFDELSGIEGVQILRYAARAAELAGELGLALEDGLIERLRRTSSNLPEVENGGRVYIETIKPTRVDRSRMVANDAICRVLEQGQVRSAPVAFTIQLVDYATDTYGTTALGVGRMRLHSRFTGESNEYAFAVLKLTTHDVHCVVSETLTGERFTEVRAALLQTFARHSLSEVVRALDHAFGETYHTARDLLLDDRRRVLAGVSEAVLSRLEDSYRQLYQENRRLMEYLRELDVPLPQGFSLAAGFLASRSFVRAATTLLQGGKDGDELTDIAAEARRWQAPLETSGVEDMLRRAVEESFTALFTDPLREGIAFTLHLLELAERLGLKLNLWKTQTLFARLCAKHLSSLLDRRMHEETVAHQISLLRRLGERLGFHAIEGIPLDTWDRL
jgi:alpha-amylase/alpha-mannosidase (GH57 family)